MLTDEQMWTLLQSRIFTARMKHPKPSFSALREEQLEMEIALQSRDPDAVLSEGIDQMVVLWRLFTDVAESPEGEMVVSFADLGLTWSGEVEEPTV